MTLTGNNELFFLVYVLLGLQLWLVTHMVLSFDPSCFSYKVSTLLQTLTPLSIRLFAGDTSLYIIVDVPIQAAEQFNLDLVKIHRWATNGW